MKLALLVVLAAVLAAGHPVAAAPGAQRFVILPAESHVSYRVNETLIFENNRLNVAIGTTNAIQGDATIDRTNPRNSKIGTITVDISQFKSDSERRDNAIRSRWLESRRFPTATFTPTSVQGLPDTYTDGHELSLQVTGQLKVRDVTKPVTFAVTLKLDGIVLTGTATTLIKMTEFGFDPPSIFGMLRAENDVRLELRFAARAAP